MLKSLLFCYRRKTLSTWFEVKVIKFKSEVYGGKLLKPKFHLAHQVSTRHDSCRASRDEHVERVDRPKNVSSVTSVSSRACSNMADDEEAVMLACTSVIVCALCVHVNKKEKRQHAVWVKDYLKKERLLDVLIRC